MLRAYPGGGAPGYGTGPLGACSRNGTQKASVRHPLGADPDGLAAADQRHRLSWWAARGLLPQGLEPSTIAAAYVRATGRQPARDPDRKQSRAYSAWELLQALAQLGPALRPLGAAAARPAPAAAPPPPRPVDPLAEPLGAIWGRTLQALELPSTRMLLSQQARLEALRPNRWGELVAVVAVAPDWLPMVQTRAVLLSDALGRALDARPVWLVLVEAGQ
jgi:hypothetical protein